MRTSNIVHIAHVQDRIINLTDQVQRYTYRWGKYPTEDNRAVLDSTQQNLEMYKRVLRRLQYESKNNRRLP